jgi:DNA-binding GntR family transcriptional regulator
VEIMLNSSLDNFIVSDKRRHKTAASFVVDALRQGILDGTIKEGTPLRQDELADKFGLSRMPIRDAIRQLESEGLVVLEPHKGATVATMTIEDIVEIFDMRIMAECTALKIAFGNIAENHLAELNDIVDAMDATKDPDRLSRLNQRFHELLYQGAKRPRLQSLIKSLHESVDRYLRFLLINLDYHKRSQQDHKQLAEACATGDRETAIKILEAHLIGGRDEVVSFLKARHATQQPS